MASGAKTDRAQLRRLLDQLDARDVLMVTRLDRLARSTRDLLNTLATITGRKAGFHSLGDTWTDTTTAHGRLMLTVLGGLAEFERDLIRTRTGEGRERAKARGVKLGRKPKLTEHQKHEAIRRRDELGRAGARNRAELQRLAQHDFAAHSLSGKPAYRWLSTGGAFRQGSTGEFLVLVVIVPGGVAVRRLRLRHREKLTTPSELLLGNCSPPDASLLRGT